jgi:hypothetical protein
MDTHGSERRTLKTADRDARPAVDDVVGRASEEKVSFAKATYLVVALLTVRVV